MTLFHARRDDSPGFFLFRILTAMPIQAGASLLYFFPAAHRISKRTDRRIMPVNENGEAKNGVLEKIYRFSGLWLHTCVTSAHRRLRQEDHEKEARHGYSSEPLSRRHGGRLALDGVLLDQPVTSRLPCFHEHITHSIPESSLHFIQGV